MKKHSFRTILFTLLLLASLGVGLAQAQESAPASPAAVAADVGTAFTYQGQLALDGTPVDGDCDMQFSLYYDEEGEYQFGSTLDLPEVPVSDGYFTVELDFGQAGYHLGTRYVKVAVRCPAGSGDYTELAPLQRVSPAPLALALPGLYTEQQNFYAAPNIIGGSFENDAADGVYGAVIAGGGAGEGCGDGSEPCPNLVTGTYGVISGGEANTAGSRAVVGGGIYNEATGSGSVVSGGWGNTASGGDSVVPGGYSNLADGDYSLAAGHVAAANHNGSFVWADAIGGNNPFATSKDNQFLVFASGGMGLLTNDTLSNGLTVNGRIIAGGTATGVIGGEPFVARGASSGISMDDRTNGASDRWVIYPDNGTLNLWYHSVSRFSVNNAGVVTLSALGTSDNGTPLCRNGTGQISTCGSSSARYKTNIAPLAMGLDVIASLRPVTFDWKSTGEADLGLVAEEVYEISPLLTTMNDEGQIEGVKYDRVSIVLVNAVQEQQAQIAELEARLAALDQGGAASTASQSPILPLLIIASIVLLLVVIAQSILLWRLFARRMGGSAAP
ncbi:MAG: tail fiber domain-containing protein [Anaerolineales bacterium]|nr:tail fiber domain-containing protein [Anaerolineales bacterium]